MMPFRKLTHYEVLASLGKGGMGEVWKARDTRLGRDVAIKTIPDELKDDEASMIRFEREARLLASLNHPNICVIYDIVDYEGQPFIVMEMLNGRTLRELSAGSLRTDQVLRLGIQLADALEAAHAEGVVHRDIKPENVFVTDRGKAKLLDFGLAKSIATKTAKAQLETLSEAGEGLTVGGNVVGTLSYMSPEQISGRTVDARTDLFALGAVLYEMTTGKRAFTGATAPLVYDAILNREPQAPQEHNPDAHPELELIIARALEKDPELRYQRASELRSDLETLQTETAPHPRRKDKSRHELVLGALLALIALVYVMFNLLGSVSEAPRFSELSATFTQLTSLPGEELHPSLSPDGRSLVYSGIASGNVDIYSRRVDGENVINLTEDSKDYDSQPRFSPDGEFIAFQSSRDGGGIFVMGATGESVRRITHFGFNPVWSPDGNEILFAAELIDTDPRKRPGDSELWTVGFPSGEPKKVFEGDAVQPHWSPSGSRIAYWAISGGQRDIWTITSSGREPVAVTNDTAVDWNPVWSPDGKYLYFSSDRRGSMNLWRVRIDEETGRTLDEPEPVTTGASGDAMYLTLAADGKRLAYGIRDTRANVMKVEFNPSTRTVVGEPVPVTEGSRSVGAVEVSPDGKALTFHRVGVQEDLFTSRSDGTGTRRLTNDRYFDRYARWSPDGSKISFFSNRSGSYQLWTINPDGSGIHQLTREPSEPVHTVWSPDGSRIAYTDFLTGSFIMSAGTAWEDQSVAVLPRLTDGNEIFAAFSWSPDGNWLAGFGYDETRTPDETGIYVYSLESEQYEKLTESGSYPRWLSDSRTLVYADRGTIYVVDRASKETQEVLSSGPESMSFLPAPSPDNRTLYYVSRPQPEADVWLISLPD